MVKTPGFLAATLINLLKPLYAGTAVASVENNKSLPSKGGNGFFNAKKAGDNSVARCNGKRNLF